MSIEQLKAEAKMAHLPMVEPEAVEKEVANMPAKVEDTMSSAATEETQGSSSATAAEGSQSKEASKTESKDASKSVSTETKKTFIQKVKDCLTKIYEWIKAKIFCNYCKKPEVQEIEKPLTREEIQKMDKEQRDTRYLLLETSEEKKEWLSGVKAFKAINEKDEKRSYPGLMKLLEDINEVQAKLNKQIQEVEAQYLQDAKEIEARDGKDKEPQVHEKEINQAIMARIVAANKEITALTEAADQEIGSLIVSAKIAEDMADKLLEELDKDREEFLIDTTVSDAIISVAQKDAELDSFISFVRDENPSALQIEAAYRNLSLDAKERLLEAYKEVTKKPEGEAQVESTIFTLTEFFRAPAAKKAQSKEDAQKASELEEQRRGTIGKVLKLLENQIEENDKKAKAESKDKANAIREESAKKRTEEDALLKRLHAELSSEKQEDVSEEGLTTMSEVD